MFRVMEYVGIHSQLLSGIRGLYQGNRHILKFNGDAFDSITVYSGVRQGCPAIPSLFTITLDPFLHYLDSLLGPRDRLRACVDGTGLVLEQLWGRAAAKHFDQSLTVVSESF